MINKLLKTFALLLLLPFLFISCKKYNPSGTPPDVLTGSSWEEVPQRAYSKRISFENGGNFSIQFRNQDNQYWATVMSGKYSISEDKLTVNITSNVEKSSTGKTIKSTPENFLLFDKDRFVIENSVLTVNYLTYPADGPVPTVAKFNRLIPID
ncbi:hypothetical protein GJU39_09645 [Pedobacter petrophilus]|uniref:Uncharacterized protein n=1 Tax=Pedobacter petrophilus TaxID=1908241 RepID=A0A7K0FYB0_9SPHI|nr:hypothetical protein [Pedobacter petrophilus]MRX76352.1 hypothetical protein [Pedobacter petrophilus]